MTYLLSHPACRYSALLKPLATLCLLVVLLSGTFASEAQAQTSLTLKGSEIRLSSGTWYHYAGGQYLDEVVLDRLILRLQNGATPTQSGIDLIVGSSGVDLVEEPMPGDYFALSVDTTLHDPLVVAADLSADSSVEQIMFNGLGYSMSESSPGLVALKESSAATSTRSTFAASSQGNPCTSGFIPNDPYWNSQGFDIDGDGIGDGQWNLCEIRAPEAWTITTGEPEVIVGVIDSPADYEHDDLIGGLWFNDAEVNGTSGVDDPGDGNICIDDLNGWDFGSGATGNGCPGDAEPSNIGDPIFGPVDHGTATAGIALARTDNQVGGSFEGMAGVAGGNGNAGTGAEYMVIAQYYRSPLSTDAESIARGINYASVTGASVVLITSGFRTNYPILESAVTEAEGRETVIVASAGNFQNGYEGLYYPAAYRRVLAVGATLSDDDRWASSSVGVNEPGINGGDQPFLLDVMAPGGEKSIISTDPSNSDGTNSGDYLLSGADLFGGTSASAPHVAGVAALILSVNPSLTALEVRRLIRLTADASQCTEVDLDYTKGQECGFGRVDAYEALKGTLETFGGRPQADLFIPAGETWDFEDVTVTFRPARDQPVRGRDPECGRNDLQGG